MSLKIHNSEIKEKITPEFSKEVPIRIYTCGPTIYDFAHIGNFRTYLFEDLLRRTLKILGYKVEQTMNITDVDDKTIRGATLKNLTLKEFTEPFRVAFFEDLKTLKIEPAEHYLDATDHIQEMIQMIEELLKKGFAYKSANGSIYFNIETFPSYGRLAHLKIEEGPRQKSLESDEYGKENVSDFVLWKAYDPERDGKIFWESPFGRGRPGWHIECSAMAIKSLGETIDIHCGGIDNLFPHHENEIAQSECCTGKQFVKFWMHSEHLLVNQQKMSKSLGNFYTLRDLLQKGYRGEEVRYALLSSHYRMQLNFTFQSLDAARASLERIRALILRLQEVSLNVHSSEVEEVLKKADQDFKAGLADDLNISFALGILFDLIRDLNAFADAGKVGKESAKQALKLFHHWDQVLGFLPLRGQEEIPAELEMLLARREEARRMKNFSLSDQLRKEIDEKGFFIEDTSSGVRLKRKI